MDLRSLLRRLSASLGVRQDDVVRDSEPVTPWYYPLSKEAEVVELIGAGSTNLEIANHFGMSKRTMDVRVSSIMMKLNIRKRTDIAAWVAQHRPA